jgi:hypothetical protein
MKKTIYNLWLVLFLLVPLTTFSQNQSVVWPWPVNEDTLFIPDLNGTGLYLNSIIAADTSGTGWQGSAGRDAWLNNTRVYVLAKNGYFPCNGNLILNSRDGAKLMIRGETGNYVVPAHYTTNPANDWYPQIYFVPLGTGLPQGRFVQLGKLFDTLMLKQVSICGRDESLPGTLDKIQGNMLEINSTGSGSIYVDSCVLKTINGQIMQLGAGGSIHAYTVRLTNSIMADMGFIGNGNLGAGRGIDCRNSLIDSLIVENNTWINFQDRLIRHYLSAQPIMSVKFNHNTVMNGMSYDGMICLGMLDSLGNGPFEIKDNLFLDNFAMGPDTDASRSAEFNDSPDMDPRSGTFKISWIVARPNTTGHITPWVISNNYYCVSDSGEALRNMASPFLYVPNPDTQEPILTSDIKRQLQANGGDTLTAFRKISFLPSYVPPLMTRFIRWYYTPEGDGIGGNDQSNVGAGAGRKKTGSGSGTGTPASHFIHDVTNNVWVYDYNRRKTEWYMDSLDCSFISTVNLTNAASDGRIIGDTRWSFTGLIPIVHFAAAPTSVDFGDVEKNTSKMDSIVISNSGNTSLVISSVVSTASDFVVTPTSGAVAAGGSEKYYITFTPTSEGALTGKIIFTSNAPSSPDTITVGGTGTIIPVPVISVAPTSINFGIITIGATKKDSVLVSNNGTADLQVTNISSSNARFTFAPATMNIPQSNNAYLVITYEPLDTTTQNGEIILTHNAAGSPDTVVVSGKGQEPVGVDGMLQIPKEFALRQNYPNPFNPTTTIQFDLPVRSNVRLLLINMLGQSISEVTNRSYEAGYHHVTLNASNLASGMYFYRLEAGKFTQVKKLILLK